MNKAQAVATYERVNPGRAFIWSASMLKWPHHPHVATTTSPQGSSWAIATTDPHGAQAHSDLYEWRLANLDEEACQQLRIERKGWQLLRKNRIMHLDRAKGTRQVIERPEEVVAIAGWPATRTPGRRTLQPWTATFEQNRLFTLRFQGQGATGELGDDWEVLAIVTWLGLWHSH